MKLDDQINITGEFFRRRSRSSLLSGFNLLNDIQTVSLENVINGTDLEYQLRSICRWYSKSFSVPLPQVSEIPIDEVLLAYYESKYEEMEPEDLEKERQRLKLSESEQRKLLAQDEQAELNLELEGQKIKEEFEKKQAKKNSADQKLNDLFGNKQKKQKWLPEAELSPKPKPKIPKILPNVEMKFEPELP